jgi:hypothetical protein
MYNNCLDVLHSNTNRRPTYVVFAPSRCKQSCRVSKVVASESPPLFYGSHETFPLPFRCVFAAHFELAMATPIEALDHNTRIREATIWLQEHEDKTIMTVVHIFQLN